MYLSLTPSSTLTLDSPLVALQSAHSVFNDAGLQNWRAETVRLGDEERVLRYMASITGSVFGLEAQHDGEVR